MTERERLIDLLLSKSCMTNKCPDVGCDECEFIAVHVGDADKIADYLLANGVRVEMPNNSVSLVDGHIETDIYVGGKKEGDEE